MEEMGKNTLRYAVIVSIVVLLSFCIANVMGCASRRDGDMGNAMGFAIAEKMKKDQK